MLKRGDHSETTVNSSCVRIYLTGPMGSGKTTVGRLLADRLGWAFVDLDALIAARAETSIAEVFEHRGEAHFRKMESEALADTLSADRLVVATGGGALASEANLRLALGAGLVVYLDASPETITARLAGDETRPLLTHQHRLLAERLSFYRRAHVTLDANEDTPDALAAQIADEIAARLSRNERR
jgi:shikimate kinase